MNIRLIVMLCFCMLTPKAFAEFLFMTNNGYIILNGYIGTNREVEIPETINEFPVKWIQQESFAYLNNLKNIIIPNSVSDMNSGSIAYCISLTNISIGSGVTNIGGNSLGPIGGSAVSSLASFNLHLLSFNVDSNNPTLSSTDGILFNKSKTRLYGYPRGKCGPYIIPSGVEVLHFMSFRDADGLTSLNVPASVTTIEIAAFYECDFLESIFFEGNAPHVVNNNSIFDSDAKTIIYRLQGTTGWSNTFQGRPTVLWNPEISNFSIETNHAIMNAFWARGVKLVLDYCTNIQSNIWVPLTTQTLNGISLFIDNEASNSASRFYRLRADNL